MLNKLADAATDNRRALKAEKPRLTALDAGTLYEELRKFRLYMNDHRLPERVYWFSGARAIASDRARVSIESYIVSQFGSEAGFQRCVAAADSNTWYLHWVAFESRLKLEAGLDDSSELNEAVRVYGRVQLSKGGGADAVDHFIQNYLMARTRMIEQGLIVDGDEKSRIRELEDIRTKIESSDLLRCLMELPDFPTQIDDADPARSKASVIGRMRQYVAARRRPGLGSDQGQHTNQFFKQGEKKNDWKKDQALMANDANKRFRAAQERFGHDGKGKSSKGKGSKGKGKEAGGGDCSRCSGTHPECQDCPNTAASGEKDFDVGKVAREKIPCWYMHPLAARRCGGFGHLARHHEPVFTERGKAEKERARDIKGSKGKGKSKERRLDMADNASTPLAERDRASQLPDALYVCSGVASAMASRDLGDICVDPPVSLEGRQDGEALMAAGLPGGYNCRGFAWVGPARVDCVWDTGSTRNSVDKAYLQALITHPAASQAVHAVRDIAPLTCTSMQKGHSLQITKLAVLSVIFKEGSSEETCR